MYDRLEAQDVVVVVVDEGGGGEQREGVMNLQSRLVSDEEMTSYARS